MRPEQIVAIVVRLFAIMLVFGALSYISGYAPYMLDENESLMQIIVITSTGLVLAVSVILWKFPNTIARKIVPLESMSSDSQPWTLDELYSFGFVILGGYFLFYSLSDGLFWIMHLISLSRDKLGVVQHTQADTFSIIITVIEIVVAFAIILGSRGLTRIIFKLRYAK